MKIKVTFDYRDENAFWENKIENNLLKMLRQEEKVHKDVKSKWPFEVYERDVFDDDCLIGDEDGGVGNLIGKRITIVTDEVYEKKVRRIIDKAKAETMNW